MRGCVWVLLLCVLAYSEGWSDYRQRRFKDSFLFGAASSAYQVEGAWNEDGKGESNWDRYFHENPTAAPDGSNGDVAADSYHNYKRDVEMLRELGVDHYRFSVAWTRVLPNGLPDKINEKGLQYYENLVDELLKYNIQPMVTLYHFDLPQPLEELGGWTNPLAPKWFEDYARVVFTRLAPKVKYWVTLNQPNVCMESYGGKMWPPALGKRGTADYLCVKYMLVAHARAYRLYEKEFKKQYKGSVGIAMSLNWYDPVVNNSENAQATDVYREFALDLYLNPIWSKEGDFPRTVKEIVAKRSAAEGLATSRLPKFSAEEIKMLKGSSDFLGINHYTTFLVEPSTSLDGVYTPDQNVKLSHGEQWTVGKSPWLAMAPYGIYKLCLYINKRYDYPVVFVTENGFSTDVGIADTGRVNYYTAYLGALLLAIEDGTQMLGYTAWSLMDNLEWTAGVSERFGLYEVDFNSPERTRTPRHSAFFYRDVIKNKLADPLWKPQGVAQADRRETQDREEL